MRLCLEGYCRHFKINCVSLDYGVAQVALQDIYWANKAKQQNQSVIRRLTSVAELKSPGFTAFVLKCDNTCSSP